MKTLTKKILTAAIITTAVSNAFGMKKLPDAVHLRPRLKITHAPSFDSVHIIHLRQLPSKIQIALRKSRFACYHIDQISSVESAGAEKFVITLDNHSGSTIATEGYGGWEDYRLVFDAEGNMVSAKEL